MEQRLPYEEPEHNKIRFDCFTAANNGDLSYFTKSITGAAKNFSASNKSGWTPIMYACSKGHGLLVSYLMMCGVKTNCRTKSNVTLLMLSILSGDMPTVECVFNAESLENRDYRSWTPLFYAVYFMQEKCVEFLLHKGANVNVEDFQKETPLILAIKSGNETIVNLLLRTASNLDVVSYKNESAVMLAKETINSDIRARVLGRVEYLTSLRERGSPAEKMTPMKWIHVATREKSRSPSPAGKHNRSLSFLGVRLSRRVSYSPSGSGKLSKSGSQVLSPSRSTSEGGKIPLWKCLAKSPAPTTVHHEVESLLSSLGLEKYWPIFRDEEVDFETLLTFTDHDLRELGISFFGPRKKILHAIQQLRLYNMSPRVDNANDKT